jgi:CheY-like chemotaxis protein
LIQIGTSTLIDVEVVQTVSFDTNQTSVYAASQDIKVAKVLRVNFDNLSSGESHVAAEPLADVTDVRLPSAAVDLNRWKDFDQIVFELRGVSEDQKPKICQKVIAAQCLLDQIPDGLALLDIESNILWNNPRLTKWFPKETLVGLNFYNALDKPVVCGVDTSPLASAVQGNKHCRATLQHAERYFRLNVAPVSDNEGQVVCLVVTLVDTTQATLERQKLQALHEAGMALADLTPQEIFEMEIDQRIELLKQNILYYTKDLLDFDVIEIRLIDSKTGLLVPLLSAGIDADASKKPLYAQAENNGVTGYVVATGDSYLCEDTANDPLYLDGLVGAKSSLTVPLKYHDEVIGSFNVESPEVGTFTENDLQFLEAFARDVAVSLNTLELLVAQKNNAAQESVEAIHSAVALPIDNILCDTVNVIEKYIGHDQAVTERLRSILKNAREIKDVIQKVGEKMAPAETVPAGIHVVKRPTLRNRRVLVIDADQQVRESAHQILEKYGCTVETASQGKESILMMQNCDSETAYHAVIADIRLPDMSGYDLLMKMKETDDEPPLILMTGFGYDPGHSIVKARQAGLRAGAILYKPFRLDQLLETVEQTVRSRNMAPLADEG